MHRLCAFYNNKSSIYKKRQTNQGQKQTGPMPNIHAHPRAMHAMLKNLPSQNPHKIAHHKKVYTRETRLKKKNLHVLLHGLQLLRALSSEQLALLRALLEHILNESLTSFVAAPHERAARAVHEAQVQGTLAPQLEDGGRHVLLDLHVTLRRTHVLAKCDDVDAYAAELLEGVPELLFRLAQAEHDGGFGDEFRACFFGGAQDVDGLLEGRAAVADERRQLGGGLDVVCVDVEAGAGYNGHLLEVAQVVACECFDKG